MLDGRDGGYLLKAADHNWGPFGEATKTALAGIALLAVPALMLERWRRAARIGR